jgi:hypothetical protein
LKARRKTKDQEKTQTIHDAMRRNTGIQNNWDWQHLPFRLREKIKKGLPAWLQERAETSDHELSFAIANVRDAGVEVTEAEKMRLCEVALRKAYDAHKPIFAKMIYGDPLPFGVVLSILEGVSEYQGMWGMPTDSNSKIMGAFLDEIDIKDEGQVDSFLDTIAGNGQCHNLCAACKILKRKLPEACLRKCLHAHWELENKSLSDLKHMCVWLQDWELAEVLLRQMVEHHLEDKNTRELAAELALELFLAHEEQPA